MKLTVFNLICPGTFSKHEFQAETKKLLDIVARSLYSEKEVREGLTSHSNLNWLNVYKWLTDGPVIMCLLYLARYFRNLTLRYSVFLTFSILTHCSGVHPWADLQWQWRPGEVAPQADNGRGRHGPHGDPPTDGPGQGHLHHPGTPKPGRGSRVAVVTANML